MDDNSSGLVAEAKPLSSLKPPAAALRSSPPKPGSVLPAIQITETDYSVVKAFPEKAAAVEVTRQDSPAKLDDPKKADVALEAYYVSSKEPFLPFKPHLF